MDKKDKEEMQKIVADGLHEVLIPALENIDGQFKFVREDISDVKRDVHDLQLSVDRIERKLDANTKRMDRHGKQLENHEKRLQFLEVVPA